MEAAHFSGSVRWASAHYPIRAALVRQAASGEPSAHLIKRDELEKVIRFIKDLVKATDSYIDNRI
jgi:hypothetical protein